ncbi:peptidoglycan bridge formation glycyltransferase FemA/FemB family protein [Patescibacteria group bacterium]|nr:peptidoglycan bridge formation glycyltransferase FemA/FemB family protein [Patescibacteria group bacterium]
MRIYAEIENSDIESSAFVIIDKTAFGFSTFDIRLSTLDTRQSTINTQLIDRIVSDAKKERTMSIYLRAPNIIETSNQQLATSKRIQYPEATRIINLQQTEEEILSQMKQKGRYNIKVAQKNGVEVHESKDVDAFYELVQSTSKRDKFTSLPKNHYRKFLNDLDGSFMFLAYSTGSAAEVHEPPLRNHRRNDQQRNDQNNAASRYKHNQNCSKNKIYSGEAISLRRHCENISSSVDNSIVAEPYKKPIAGLMGVIWNGTGIYYYGASSYEYRALMAPYALQWGAIKYCKTQGCSKYDLFGIAPLSHRERGVGGRGKDHPWSGVSSFKEKFGGDVIEYPEEKMIVMKPVVNWLIGMKRRMF